MRGIGRPGAWLARHWHSLSWDDRWALVAYLATPAWSYAFALWTPSTLASVFDPLLLILIAGLPLLGFLPAAIGVLIRSNLYVELAGAVLRYFGVLTYFIIQISLAVSLPDRRALSGLVFLLLLEMSGRFWRLAITWYRRLIRGDSR